LLQFEFCDILISISPPFLLNGMNNSEEYFGCDRDDSGYSNYFFWMWGDFELETRRKIESAPKSPIC